MLSVVWHVGFYFNKDPLAVLLLLAHFLQGCWQGYVLYLQFKNVSMALTYNESVNFKKYKYLFSNNRFHNPFSKSDRIANLLAYVQQNSGDWHNLYRLDQSHQAPIALAQV